MLLATMDGIAKDDIDFEKIMNNFVSWYDKAKYTPNNEVFDIGNTTRKAIDRYKNGEDIATCGCKNSRDNGNGSLMRIAPIAFFLRKKYGENFMENNASYDYIAGLSELTHAHMRSIISCGFYISIMNEILNNKEKNISKIDIVQNACNKVFKMKGFGISDEIELFTAFEDIDEFAKRDKSSIFSSGYVIDTIECCIWNFINSNSTKESILNAINMGEDTDTNAALVGGLYNLYEDDNNINEYFDKIKNPTLIEDVTRKFSKRMK